jgi:hypothetical protein
MLKINEIEDNKTAARENEFCRAKSTSRLNILRAVVIAASPSR